MFILVNQVQYEFCEVFTSMANMENLAETEQLLYTSFKAYLKAEEQRMKVLRNFMTRIEEAQSIVNETNIAKYLGNPINTYLMLRRLSVEWRQVEQQLTSDSLESEGMLLFAFFFCLVFLFNYIDG